MRVSLISTLFLGFFHSTIFPSSLGLEGAKKIGIDDVYKPRKWSQVQDGPYRMVVSSRDQKSGETQLDSRKATRARQGQEELKEKESKSEATNAASNRSKIGADAYDVPNSRQDNDSSTRAPENTDDEPSHKSRTTGERRKHKTKYEHIESMPLPRDDINKTEKPARRTVVKLARKRERILSNENFRKAHRISNPEGYFAPVNQSTLPHKADNHYRSLDRGLSRGSIIPYYDFGKKLSTGKTPNVINLIEGSSTPSLGGYDITTHAEDDDIFHEHMDENIMKLRAVERNTVPLIRPQIKIPAFKVASYLKSSSAYNSEEEEVQSTTPLQVIKSTTPPTEPSNIATTRLPPNEAYDESSDKDQKSNVEVSSQIPTTEIPDEVEVIFVGNNSTSEQLKEAEEQTNMTMSSLLPIPSPTTKILSTAVVTSVSLKETRHPRIKEVLMRENGDEATGKNTPSVLDPHLIKSHRSLILTEPTRKPTNISSSQNSSSNNTLFTSTTSTTRHPPFDRFHHNRTVPIFKNSTLLASLPITNRPTYKPNIEFHIFTTKVPMTSTTHKPVNRSLYSTHQREQQKNKFISSQLYKANKNLTASRTNESDFTRLDSNATINEDDKPKMYLTIISKMPNTTAIYRSTFIRNGTKPISPVLRVIATPSSYIEVPRIISRIIQNSTATTEKPTNESEQIKKVESFPDNHNQNRTFELPETSTALSSDIEPAAVEQDIILPSSVQNVLENPRGIRMNNHRMVPDEATTEEVPVEDLSTVPSYPAEEANKHDNPSPTHSPRAHTNDTIENKSVEIPTYPRPGLSLVYLGQKNRSRVHNSAVEVAYSNGFGIVAYVLAVLGVIPLILGGFVLLRQILIKSKKKMLDESEYSSEYNRTPLPAKLPRIPSHISNWEAEKATCCASAGQPNSTPGNSQNQSSVTQPQIQHLTNQHHHTSTQQHQPHNGNWEFPRDKLRLQTLLGEGNFGQVWKAEADDISGHEGLTRLVAVKTVKEGSGGREREDLLRELVIMKELVSHPNVVTLLGCCTDREPFLLIMEYVMYGKMLTFLREHRTRAHYFNFSDLNSALVSRDLTVFAYCVARGMEFLVSKGIIHRDLAARNILVDHNKMCKIADFGMSRNVSDTGEIYEQRTNRGALPIRWMAPEALHCSVFTHKSDVWSFGILVWEIITLGCTPYQTMRAREVMHRVKEGYRLERPNHCSQDLYKVITRCWAADSSKRPSFSELKHDFATLLSDPQTNGACVDLEALTEEMSSHSC